LKKAFTITELLVAIALLGALLASSSVVFQKAVQSERIARATAEITRKLHVITDQINRDFRGLHKDGEIMLLWVPNPVDDDGDETIDRYERLDRVVFYTNGDFATYHAQPIPDPSDPTTIIGYKHITGKEARVCYTFGKNSTGIKPKDQHPTERVLLRTQHIYTSDSDLFRWPILPLSASSTDELDFRDNYFTYEYDNRTMAEWMSIPYNDGSPTPPPGGKATMLSIITGVEVGPTDMPASEWGPTFDADDPYTVHMLFSEGVGQFSIQGWYYDDGFNNLYGKFNPPIHRWFPMLDLDPDDDDLLTSSDFLLSGTGVLHPTDVSRLFYHSIYGRHVMGPDPLPAGTTPQYNLPLNQANFNIIPGLGRALKFTFTLYDSKGIFKDGKTFTHIVYLGK
jgi:prepilin-type N-terminal cleavage/methylation domain-containing protein